MFWVDVAGAPGTGKSTLCDGLWPPHGIRLDEGQHPKEWAAFFKVTGKLLDKTRHHSSHRQCRSMTGRAFAKMTAVHRLEREGVYVQTGFAQRGLGLGWRLEDPEEIRPYFELMPVSLGVVLLHADVETVCRRNVARGKDRSYMVRPMERPRQIAVRTLQDRGVPFIEIDTAKPLAACRETLSRFAREALWHAQD